MSAAQEAQKAGKQIVEATGEQLVARFNAAIERIIGPLYKAVPASIVDHTGTQTEAYTSVVYVGAPLPGSDAIPADNAAAVIDVVDALDAATLRTAYERIALAKRLKKTSQTGDAPRSTTTLGIIFAKTSAVPLEKLGEELQALNAQTPDRQWPDMLASGLTGVVNYAAQFPGDASLPGDYMLPTEDFVGPGGTPPMYIVLAARPTGEHTFNKMLAFLIGHLATFRNDTKLPDFMPLLEGMTNLGIPLTGYQYNLSGKLAPVPRQFYNDRYLAPRPLRIEGPGDELLATVSFLPWQDGGAILMRGGFPLEMLFALTRPDLMKGLQFVRRPSGLQISYALPISEVDFNNILLGFQGRSNMRIRREEGKFVVQKIADEGTSSPFVARLFLGMLHLRDLAYSDEAGRDKFDTPFETVSLQLSDARSAAQEIGPLWDSHAQEIASGAIARVHGQTIRVDKSIDKELRRTTESLLDSAVRTIKQGMQSLTAAMAVDIGFLFQQQNAFDNAVAALQQTDPLLAEYLKQTRAWSEPLINIRNGIEHAGWKLPKVVYGHKGSRVTIVEPTINGQPVTQFAKITLDRLCCFVEEVTAHCIQRQLSAAFTLTEIPIPERPKEAPERFRITIGIGGLPRWQITYHAASFEEV